MSQIRLTTLDNGLRVITDTVPDVHSVALGIWVGVGTRDEDIKHNGVAHMVEHMLFKGTEKRSAQDIVEQIENVGGNVNAYTSREVTSYHIHLLKEHAPLALDILADMYQNYALPEDEIERERGVILQEIGMCNDTPDDLVFDNYFETAYPGQTMGAPILGTADIVANMSREAMEAYLKRLYTPLRTVISAAGNIDHDTFVAQVRGLFTSLPEDTETQKPEADYQGGDNRLSKDLEQSHIILGFRGLSRMDKNFYSAQALSTAFGGGMSSRLFQEIREKRGLVYSVFSFHSAYQDDGQFGIYAGTGPDKLGELVPVVCDEVKKLAGDLSEEEVVRAKTQMKASILMARESMMNRADRQAKHLLFKEAVLDPDKLIKNIEAVDLGSVRTVAEKIFSTRPTLAGLGPLEGLESYDNISQRLAA